jgi:hypothetical protein
MTTKAYRKKKNGAQKKAPKPAETKPSNGAPFKFTGTTDELLAAADRIRADRAAANPHPLAQADALFDDGLIRGDTTLLQLVRGIFDAGNASKSDNPVADFLSEVLLANNDELHLVQFVNSELDHTDVIGRVLLRVQWRAEIAAEIARRVEKGEVLR